MSSLDEMTIAGAMNVLSTQLPDGISACEYQLAFDEDAGLPVVRVAMILAYVSWNEQAVKACEQATTAAWDVLAQCGYIPDVICRTAAEHRQARGAERWEQASGNC
jgi:hypothetical protein